MIIHLGSPVCSRMTPGVTQHQTVPRHYSYTTMFNNLLDYQVYQKNNKKLLLPGLFFSLLTLDKLYLSSQHREKRPQIIQVILMLEEISGWLFGKSSNLQIISNVKKRTSQMSLNYKLLV